MNDLSILHAHGASCGHSNTKGLFTGLIAQSEPVKTCQKCCETKPLSLFSKKKSNKDGLQYHCKTCVTAYYLSYQEKNKDKLIAKKAAYHAANRDALLVKKAAYYAANRHIQAEKNAINYSANKAKYAERHAKYYALNKEKALLRAASWVKANPERRAEIADKWEKQNVDARRVFVRNRRARQSNNGGKLSRGITKLLMQEQGGKCACCLVDLLTTGHHLDHVMPIALGGPNIDSNIQLLCKPCNSSKGAKHPLSWMAAKGIFTP